MIELCLLSQKGLQGHEKDHVPLNLQLSGHKERLTVNVPVLQSQKGVTDEAVVRRLLAYAGLACGIVYGKSGKGALLERLPNYNQAARFAPWLVVVDLDQDAECAPPFVRSLLPDPAGNMHFRVAVRAVESWLLADAGRLAAFLGVPVARIPADPDAQPDPKRTLVDLAERNAEIIVPGYTHLQRAQPVLVAHHLLAYYEMLERDRKRFKEACEHSNILPLGSAALAGSTFDLDREMVAKELGFEGVSRNSMDAVSDRDFVLDFLYAASVLMMHLSRMSEELIIWSTREFGFVDLPDAFCTGSSIMPQKKNPDIPELIRGKTGRAYGHLMALLTTMKGLPLTYNKDMQEDKEALFDTADTVGDCLLVITRLLREVTFNGTRMKRAAGRGYQVIR